MQLRRHYSIVFRPNVLYPAFTAPRALLHWVALPWPDGSVVYVDREHERIAMARAGLLD